MLPTTKFMESIYYKASHIICQITSLKVLRKIPNMVQRSSSVSQFNGGQA